MLDWARKTHVIKEGETFPPHTASLFFNGLEDAAAFALGLGSVRVFTEVEATQNLHTRPSPAFQKRHETEGWSRSRKQRIVDGKDRATAPKPLIAASKINTANAQVSESRSAHDARLDGDEQFDLRPVNGFGGFVSESLQRNELCVLCAVFELVRAIASASNHSLLCRIVVHTADGDLEGLESLLCLVKGQTHVLPDLCIPRPSHTVQVARGKVLPKLDVFYSMQFDLI
jgi:hypothetical protein